MKPERNKRKNNEYTLVQVRTIVSVDTVFALCVCANVCAIFPLNATLFVCEFTQCTQMNEKWGNLLKSTNSQTMHLCTSIACISVVNLVRSWKLNRRQFSGIAERTRRSTKNAFFFFKWVIKTKQWENRVNLRPILAPQKWMDDF